MALVRWSPASRNLPIARSELDDLFEDFFGGFARPWLPRRWVTSQDGFSPRVNVSQTEKAVILKAEVPGLTKDDLDISVTNNVVTLKGERKSEDQSSEQGYYCQECSYGSFERSIMLPENVVSDKAKAELQNGILTLTLPKAEPQGKVKIEVH